MLSGEFKTTPIAVLEQVVFVMAASIPYRPDSVKNPLCRELECGRRLGVSGFATVQFAALGEQLGAGGSMYGSVYTPATEQGRVRGVHDRVYTYGRDIPLDGDELRHSLQLQIFRFDDTSADGDAHPSTAFGLSYFEMTVRMSGSLDG
jgi:hypothetical protein